MVYTDVEDTNLNDINLNVLRLSNIYRDRECDIETMKQEDSNSGGSVGIISQINEIYQQSNGSNSNHLMHTTNSKGEENNRIDRQIRDNVKEKPSKQLYSTQNQNKEPLIILSHSEDWYYCEICGTSCSNKMAFDTHYNSHLNKCKICLAVFTSSEGLDNHLKEIHNENEGLENLEVSLVTIC